MQLEIKLSEFPKLKEYMTTSWNKAVELGYAKGVRDVMERTEAKLLENIYKYNAIDTGELASSIYTIKLPTGFIIGCGADYACYVEFGTGIVGMSSPHEIAGSEGWKYDVHNHGLDGWYYYDEHHDLHWTMGQPSRPFMYDTWLWAKHSYSRIINEHIRKELNK